MYWQSGWQKIPKAEPVSKSSASHWLESLANERGLAPDGSRSAPADRHSTQGVVESRAATCWISR